MNDAIDLRNFDADFFGDEGLLVIDCLLETALHSAIRCGVMRYIERQMTALCPPDELDPFRFIHYPYDLVLDKMSH